MSNTEFDINRLTLTLLDGEQFKTQSLPSVGGTLVIKDRKLKDLVVKRADAETLHVIYKDGTLEILKRHSSSAPYRINAIQFENGERLSFRYALGESLERIFNDKGDDLLVLTYSGGNLSTVDTLVDGGRYARVRFSYTNGRLTGVTAPYDRSGTPGSAAYLFRYTLFRNGMIAIEGVQPPTGGEERITYTENGHAYGNNQYIPRAASWVQIPGGNQPRMTKNYSYSSGTNFTGYPFSGGFQEGEDNLYRVNGDYTYWTDETCVDADSSNKVLMVTRTQYNKFHLLTEESVLREGTRTKTSIAYNMVSGQFSVQPANLQLPKTITKRYELVTPEPNYPPREELQSIQTDDYGNELSRTEPSGVCTEYSYYPIAGEVGKCPADPQRLFQRYLKHERLVPVGGAPAARLTEYTHLRMPPSGSSYVVLQQSSNQTGVLATQQEYYMAPIELLGRLKSVTSTIGGQALVSEFTYTVTGDDLVETRRLKESATQWLEAKRTLSLVNRRLLSVTRDGGSVLHLAFDVSGRLTSETVSAGTPQQATRSYAYHFLTKDKGAHLITTDAQGNQSIAYFDGAGRQVSDAQRLGPEQERATGTWRYDALGQTVETVNFDYVTGNRQISLTSTYSYSRWGNVSRVTGPDGRVTINEYDPLLNLAEEGVVGGERLKTYFNAHNQPVKVERLDANNNKVEMESRTYDGLGRCVTVVDVNKTSTELTYDAYDRRHTALQQPADGTAQRLRQTDYAPGTSSELVSAVTIEGKQLGTRAYDKLGRMTRQARGTGQATTWEYEAGWMQPVAMVSPRAARQSVTYNKELDVPSRIEMTGLQASIYQHDPVAGVLTRSQTNGLIHEFAQDANGHPQKDVQTANGTSLSTQYDYSPGGRLLHQTSADNQRSQFEYDAAGRFSRMTTGAMVIEQTYDTLSRPRNLTTAYDGLRVVTQVSYDSLGRESERRFEQNGALLQVMTSTYYVNSLLHTRVLRNASSQLLIGETFTYDAYLRLKTYRCEGSEHPKDHLGRGIVGQNFSFDSLNNITRVVTTFADGTHDTCERYFTGSDPTQLTRLTHTRPARDVTLAYDAAGNLQAGPSGQVYTFNAFEQLTGAKVNGLQYSYQYDAESRQVLASRSDEQPVMLAYAGDRLDTLVEGSKKIRYFDGGDEVIARSGGADGPQLHMNDASGSVRGVSAPGQAPVRRHYTPYGDTKIPLEDGKARSMADLQLPAFNGQRLDAAINLYFLGNGLRAYDPDLMMFLQPDPLSPFDEGGINSYAYCAGNPINLVDPSGLWPNWLQWLLAGAALAMMVVTAGFAAPALAGAVTGYAAATAAAAAAAGSALAATKAVTAAAAGLALIAKASAMTAAGLGLVGATLSVTALSIAAVDKKMGWDRSHHINNLGWASFGFSVASWMVSAVGAFTAGKMAYNAALSAAGGRGVGYNGILNTPAGSGVLAAGKSVAGLSYKFRNDLTTFSKAFGVTRFALRVTNTGRAIEGRSISVSAGSRSDPVQSDPASSAQPQRQAVGSHVQDMPASSAGFYQAFRDEVTRIRQPIMGELYRG